MFRSWARAGSRAWLNWITSDGRPGCGRRSAGPPPRWGRRPGWPSRSAVAASSRRDSRISRAGADFRGLTENMSGALTSDPEVPRPDPCLKDGSCSFSHPSAERLGALCSSPPDGALATIRSNLKPETGKSSRPGQCAALRRRHREKRSFPVKEFRRASPLRESLRVNSSAESAVPDRRRSPSRRRGVPRGPASGATRCRP